MKTKYLYLIGVLGLLLFSSCRSEEEKLKAQLNPVLTDLVLRDSLITQVDSLVIFRVDTLTDMIHARRRIINMERFISIQNQLAKTNTSMAELALSSAKLSKSTADMYQTTLRSPNLANMERESMRRHAAEFDEYIKASEAHLDSSRMYMAKIEQLKKDIQEGKIDSVKFKGYVPWFWIMGSNENNTEVKLDSLFAFVSANMRIIRVKLDK